MHKILIYTEDFELSEKMDSLLTRSLNNPLFMAMNSQTLATELDSKVFSLGILREYEFTERTEKALTQIRRHGYSFPLLIATEKLTPTWVHFLQGLQDVHILVAPFNDKALVGLARKLLLARRVPKQIFRRFNTNQLAELESLSSGNSVLTCMYNLSQGGGYVEFDSADPITVGDLLKIRVALEQTEKQYALNAKVIWTTPKGRFSGRFGCGFKFVTNQDAYRSLISKL